ncbi:MAG TPA: HAD hydrolase family protein [Gemmatimonadales bacterium]|jgi:3-deoxy-D-manno-octulosonate 8-phosphate phosphatase (KDO 8-P phosphatase)|nr:HAD hydrolase family protein [Gemmatimonadales bacterium]
MFDATVARGIRILGLDVDGVLTDNGVYIGEQDGARVEYKRFDIQDGLGLRILQCAGIEVAWITGRVAPSTLLRADELHINAMITVPPTAKVPAVEALLRERGLDWSALAYVGDDVPDIPVLRRAGLAIAVSNARDEVKAVARHVTVAQGGRGAVREVVDGLLKARGEWDSAVAAFFAEATLPA